MNSGLASILTGVFFLLSWLLSPYILQLLGKPDGSAWIQLWLGPTLILGLLSSITYFFKSYNWLSYLIVILIILHILIILGMYPK
jgi:O-antigen/teichoic acid export membrane protein